ncbi:hypothetical protein DFP85_11797 [Halomonas ventosae]|uniref:Uncharacterized protein n=1 Tax=Halomonas ventosae TaxID=229007 RepID=A0A4R6ZHQ7_9GAMM|nr:hypothetical protein [Halomonas ventosae]TDR51504.1 hypothetical protein DFP85_11797 [Halomonas ventosae]
MPDPHDPRRDAQQNAAWRAAREWQARARQTRADGPLGGLKLLLTWLLFGTLMIVAMVFGLIFLLLGWALMPLLRHRLKKRMEQMRAEQAEDVDGASFHYQETRYRETHTSSGSHREQQVLEGDYEVKSGESREGEHKDPDRT